MDRTIRGARHAALMLMWVSCGAMAFEAPFKPPAQREQIKLAYGVNNVKAGDLALRIVRAQVGTMSASTFDTWTVYLLPAKAGEPWMHVTMPVDKGMGFYNLRNHETGDANTQAIAFYRDGTRLYAVQATKIGPAADANGSRKTLFDFKVFVFNENDEIPMFNDEKAMRSTGRYVDAREALQQEFFRR